MSLIGDAFHDEAVRVDPLYQVYYLKPSKEAAEGYVPVALSWAADASKALQAGPPSDPQYSALGARYDVNVKRLNAIDAAGHAPDAFKTPSLLDELGKAATAMNDAAPNYIKIALILAAAVAAAYVLSTLRK